MKIVNLIEDTPGTSGCRYEHGLSFYIETAHHRLLLDTGAGDAFLKNAEQKGIDLTKVDTVVISHGHYDHTGGLLTFAERNRTADIYLRSNALGDFYNLRGGQTKYIGMDKRIGELDRVILVEDDLVIDGELSLFTHVKGRRLWPRGNQILKEKQGDVFVQDEFDHEQYLVVTEGERRVLLSGCAHNGILNILEAYRTRYGGEPTHVISGFHTTMPEYAPADDALIAEIATELAKMGIKFYSGHCTGAYPMQILERIMGIQLTVLHSGDELL